MERYATVLLELRAGRQHSRAGGPHPCRQHTHRLCDKRKVGHLDGMPTCLGCRGANLAGEAGHGSRRTAGRAAVPLDQG